jgi:hypothetical protein
MTFQQMLCKVGIHNKILRKIYFFRLWSQGFMDYTCRRAGCSYNKIELFEAGQDLIVNVD